jgi:hypothetical protein
MWKKLELRKKLDTFKLLLAKAISNGNQSPVEVFGSERD